VRKPVNKMSNREIAAEINWVAGGKTSETDPHEIDQHAAGAKLDKGKTRLALVLGGFANALEIVGQVGTFGADKYTDNGWREVPDGVERYSDALLRHVLAELRGETYDKDSGFIHAAQTAWNALARLELIIKKKKKPTHTIPWQPPTSR